MLVWFKRNGSRRSTQREDKNRRREEKSEATHVGLVDYVSEDDGIVRGRNEVGLLLSDGVRAVGIVHR